MARASQPLRRKLMATMLLTTRDESLEQVATLARIVSANSTAAVAFRDEQDAQEVLRTLRTEPAIVSAALYDESGKMLAAYAAAGTSRELYPQRLGPDGYRFSGNKIRLRINLAAAQEAKLTISSKLLRPAQIVEPGQD